MMEKENELKKDKEVEDEIFDKEFGRGQQTFPY